MKFGFFLLILTLATFSVKGFNIDLSFKVNN